MMLNHRRRRWLRRHQLAIESALLGVLMVLAVLAWGVALFAMAVAP